MKTYAEYKQNERDRKKEAGLKRIEFYVHPENISRIKEHVFKLERNIEIIKNIVDKD